MRTNALALVLAATCAMSVSGATAPGMPPTSEASQARAQVLRVMALRGSKSAAVMPARPEQEKRAQAVPAPEKAVRAVELSKPEEAPPGLSDDGAVQKKKLKPRFLPQRPRAAPMPATGRVLKPQAVNASGDARATEQTSAKVRPLMAKPTMLKPMNVKAKRSIRLPSSVQTGPVSSADAPL